MDTFENEFHFLTQCSFFYNTERTALFNKAINIISNFALLNNVNKVRWLLL